MPYFDRIGEASFAPTAHVGGAWNTREQHIAPAMGILAHMVELDRDRRRSDGLVISRLSYDILGTIPMEPVAVTVRVRRPGRTIELVEAVLSREGRPAAVLRAWLMRPGGTEALAGSAFAPLPAPGDLPAWDASAMWAGGFIASVQVRRACHGTGRAAAWVRTDVPLLDEPVSPTARVAGLVDVANGMAARVSPEDAAYPNIDLSAHLFRQPRGEWLGLDTSVSFGPTGQGLTSSVLHDLEGPLGTVAQCLTVRPSTR